MNRRDKRGFTLIELLVVIAIIAILAAILFPIFQKAKRAGQKSVCLSNFKQVGFAMLLYVDDNDSRYPAHNLDLLPPGINAADFSPAQYPHMSNTATGVIWVIRKYVKSTKFWTCPLGAVWRNGSATYDNPKGVATTISWGMAGRIKGPGIGEVYTNYNAFALTRDHLPMRHDLATNREGEKLCAMGKTPTEFAADCKRSGHQPWMFHDGYANAGPSYRWIPHGGIGGVYYDGHVQFFKDLHNEYK